MICLTAAAVHLLGAENQPGKMAPAAQPVGSILYFIVYIQCCVGCAAVDDIVFSLTPARLRRLLRLWRLLKLNILSAK